MQMTFKRSWIVPNLGGWLTIANLLSLLMLIGLARLLVFHTVFAIVACGLTLPIAIFWMMPSLGGPTYADVIVVPLVIVINAFLWGYGIARLWRFCTKLDDLEDHEQKLLEEVRKKTPTANS